MKTKAISRSEWVVASVGVILLAFCIAVMLVGTKSDSPEAPVIVFRINKTTATKAGFLVQAEAKNEGAVAASKVISGQRSPSAQT